MSIFYIVSTAATAEFTSRDDAALAIGLRASILTAFVLLLLVHAFRTQIPLGCRAAVEFLLWTVVTAAQSTRSAMLPTVEEREFAIGLNSIVKLSAACLGLLGPELAVLFCAIDSAIVVLLEMLVLRAPVPMFKVQWLVVSSLGVAVFACAVEYQRR